MLKYYATAGTEILAGKKEMLLMKGVWLYIQYN